jgi:nucleotide-binding universal stress UspA family protein
MTATDTPRATHLGDAHALRPRHPGPVLLAADGRAPTDATALAARLAAGRLGAAVEVLGVLEPIPAYAIGYEVAVIPPNVESGRRAELEAELRARVGPILGARGRWHPDVTYGAAGRVIADAARDRRASLIVVDSGRHGVVDRLFGEDVSDHVVRRASTPVLAVAPELAGGFRTAVVGVDFSAASIRAALTALALLDATPDTPGRLTLVHVRSPVESRFPAPVSWAAEYESSVAEMFERLRGILRPHAGDDVTVESCLRSGDVVDRLLEVAEETGAELIAVGTHGPGWVERLLVGSVASTTLRRARRSVLVAPVADAADRMRLELQVTGEVTISRQEDWGVALDAFTQRNLLRRARLEVGGRAAAVVVAESAHYRFAGATYDAHDERVEIMLADESEGTSHLTHSVSRVRSIEVVGTERDRALFVEDARGHTVLTFTD